MTSIPDQIWKNFRRHLPPVDFCSLRYVSTESERIKVSSGKLDEHKTVRDTGICVSVVHNGGAGYAATSRLDSEGVRCAIQQAVEWAELCSQSSIIDYQNVCFESPSGQYETHEREPWQDSTLLEKIALLTDLSQSMTSGPYIAGRFTAMERTCRHSVHMFADGGLCSQITKWITPSLYVLAHKTGETQCRSWGGSLGACVRQGGLEHILGLDKNLGKKLADESCQLINAPDCPDETTDLVVMPDQMAFQIHESIGHPLELDRILGDERNMAGTSFVTEDMVGSYRYGSDLLNVVFDPTVETELASYGWDDDGTRAEKQTLIDKGILKRVLGGHVSQSRSGLPGVACSRAESWYRPPLDRMGNINIEPGQTSLNDMIASIENGLLVSTNRSWSIDDSRNKFQFGCEWGELIKNGQRSGVVKNPNYRGISAAFWRNLKAVGDKDSVGIYGVPFCGKAEPGQVITVGHASPACLFSHVDVFGGSHA